MKHLTPYILLIAILFTIISCNDEEQFVSDGNALISFSSDTISFDTVFATIGSSTKNLQVYNNNDKGVKLPFVRLASGGKSGFRLNVDGQNGYSFSDVEILKHDSIFVFVEVTVNPQDKDTPILIKDSLQFALGNGKYQQVILQAYGQDVIIMRGEEFTEDTTLSASRPYLIYDSLVVKPNVTLNIEPGATLCFHSQATLDVHGKLIAKGTQDKPITFRGDRTDKMFPYLPYDRLDGQWGGINLYRESVDNELDYVDIHGGDYGIICDSTGVEKNKVTILNSSIHNVKSSCINSVCNKILVANSQLTNAGTNCLFIYGGDNTFYHVTVAQFYPWSIPGAALKFSNRMGEAQMSLPLHSLHFYNSIIIGTGGDDHVEGTRFIGDTEEETLAVPFNIGFHNCLVRTDTVGAGEYFSDCVLEHVDSIVFGEGNFKSINTGIYAYNFELDSLSRARNIGNPIYSKFYTKDKNGKPRKTDAPDAGCYEY